MLELLACAGITAIFMYGKPTKTIRDQVAVYLPMLPKCALCAGFWVGVGMGLYLKEPLYPFASASFCWLLDAVVNALREYYVEDDPEPGPPRL